MNQLKAEQADLNEKIATYEDILNNQDVLEKVVVKELNQVKKDFGSPRRTEITEKAAKIEINEKALVADETVRVLVSRDGYLKRSSLRSYQSTDETDNGLPAGDEVIFEKTMSTLSNLYLFTNKGNLIYRPVHELVETKWKETGQHLSQELGLAQDEEIIRVFEINDLKATDNFLLATNDGYIKQVALADLQPTRTYKSRAIIAMKLKQSDSKVVRVDQVKADSNQEITLVTNQAYAIRYDINEIPTSGARAAGVKSVNLKDDDYIVDYVLASPETVDEIKIGLITQRGAFKQLELSLINKVTRAKRGVMVLRELKTKPHRITALSSYGQNHELILTTSSQRQVRIDTNTYPLGDRYSNGSFVLDPTTDGRPISLKLGEVLTNKKDDVSNLFE